MDTGRAVLGVALVGIGGLVLLDQQEVLDAGAIVSDWWPVLVLVAAGLDLLRRPPRVVSATVLGIIGLALLGVTTGVLGTSVWEVVWPLGFVALGVWLLVRRPGASARDATRDEQVDVVAVFSGRRLAATAPRFRGGSVTAVFGGVEVDLTSATIDGEAVLDAVALFGSVDVVVPLGWRVLIDGPAIFGGHESHVPPPSDPEAPTLRVRATAIFGGIDVKSPSSVPMQRPAAA